MAALTYQDFRSAARSLRAAEFGRVASRAARPVSLLGVVRGRGPLPVMLYVASREGRLVWQNETDFAVLEPPIVGRSGLFTGGLRLSLARIVDRCWEQLIIFGPPVLALLLALLLVLVASRPVGPVILLTIVALPMLGVLHIAVLFVCMLVTGARSIFRQGRRVDTAELAAGSNWHVQMCHQENPARANGLIDRLADRMTALVTEQVRRAGLSIGGQADGVRVTHTLAFLMSAVTTTAMREAIQRANRARLPHGPDGDVVVLCPPGSEQPVRALLDRGTFVFYYLGALAVMIVVQASVVVGLERSGCASAGCVGRPATYVSALQWLAYRLLFAQPAGVTPARAYTWGIGWLDSVAALMVLPVGYCSVRNMIQMTKEKQREYDESVAIVTSVATVLILVVKQLERDAVRTAVRAVNGKASVPLYKEQHTVFDLDVIGDVRVLLAQSARQGMASPAGMLSTADDVIRACRPDYVILTGICYGLWDRDEEIGDIIVSQTVFDIDHRKMIDGDDGPVAHHRGERVVAGATLLDRFNTATADRPQPPRVHFGELLSSTTMLNSAVLRARQQRDHPDAAGGDMEGASVCAAAARAKVDWIVVKGISDRGMDVTDEHQPLAARNAAEFVVDTIALGGLRRPSD